MMEDHKVLLMSSAALAGGALAALWLRQRRQYGATAAAPTDFEACLKRHTDNPSLSQSAKNSQSGGVPPTSFEAYLRAPPPSTVAASAAAPPRTKAPAGPPPHSRPVTVLFGTEFGFSKEVAEKACQALEAAGTYWPELVDMADHPAGLPLERCQALLVVCSTQGDGVAPAEAREFCDWLGGVEAPALPALHFSVAALGDRSYTHFARCGRRLDERLEGLGGARLAPRADINKEDWGAIDRWIGATVAGLQALPLRTAAELGWESAAGRGESAAGGRKWSKSRPFYGTVVAVEGLCSLSNPGDKNTVRVELDLGDSGLEYEPGDALGVWPTNAIQVVEELLDECEADGDLQVPVPPWHYQDAALAGPEAAAGCGAAVMTLREALSRAFDLRSPRRDLLQLLHAKLKECAAAVAANGLTSPASNGHEPAICTNTHANGRAAGLTQPAAPIKPRQKGRRGGSIHAKSDSASGIDVLVPPAAAGAQHGPAYVADRVSELAALLADPEAAECYLAPRHVVDVLRDWAPVKLAPSELLPTLRQLAPRLYSISSSPLERPRRVQITVAVVRYHSLGADRLGVCSTQLGERAAVGQTLPVFVSRNPDFRLPPSAATPLIMVGPGTGLAPFRAFLQHRLLGPASGDAAHAGPAVLFFGCRRRDQDYLYGAQLEQWAAEGSVRLFTAFSREQASKMYVQTRLREQGALVWELLQAGAHFYVCGDAASMAGEVEAALVETIARHGDRTSPGQYLEDLAAAGRYQRDVWV